MKHRSTESRRHDKQRRNNSAFYKYLRQKLELKLHGNQNAKKKSDLTEKFPFETPQTGVKIAGGNYSR